MEFTTDLYDVNLPNSHHKMYTKNQQSLAKKYEFGQVQTHTPSLTQTIPCPLMSANLAGPIPFTFCRSSTD